MTIDISQLSRDLDAIDKAIRYGQKPRLGELEELKMKLDRLKRFLQLCDANKTAIEGALAWRKDISR